MKGSGELTSSQLETKYAARHFAGNLYLRLGILGRYKLYRPLGRADGNTLDLRNGPQCTLYHLRSFGIQAVEQIAVFFSSCHSDYYIEFEACMSKKKRYLLKNKLPRVTFSNVLYHYYCKEE